MPASSDVYRRSGVDIDRGNEAVRLMRAAVASTHGPQVLSGTGAFGGAFTLADGTVLVASTDSVGTKLMLATLAGRHRSIGIDLVNHCVNDILASGARPLFFLDYYAASLLQPEIVVEVVEGIADACRQAGCALLGGETAELPGMYEPGEYDIAGFIVGCVRRDDLLPQGEVCTGDVLLGLPSSGPHTNGYSLIRRVLAEQGKLSSEGLAAQEPELGGPLADVLLEPHRSYLAPVQPLLESRLVKAIAHITGGGLPENLPRVLPAETHARIDGASWQPPAVFGWLQERGSVSAPEMYRVFNMGVGLVLVVAMEHVEEVRGAAPEAWVLGEVVAGQGSVEILGVPGA